MSITNITFELDSKPLIDDLNSSWHGLSEVNDIMSLCKQYLNNVPNSMVSFVSKLVESLII